MDLINRADAIDAIIKLKHKPEFNSANSIRDCYVLTEAQEAIKHLPSADVVEVVHGEWIKMDKRGKNVQCSKCGNTLDLRGVNAGRGDANYCPNCGAKMSTQSNAFSTH